MDEQTQLLIQGAVWLIGLSICLLVLFVVVRFRTRLRRQREEERLADARFEAQMMAQSSLAAPKRAAVPPRPAEERFDVPLPSPPAAPPAPSLQPKPTEGANDLLQRVLHQLKAAGMLRSIEGYMELHGDARAAAILLMSSGKRALLVPYYETEFFALRNLRRFDLLVFVGRDGRAVVITPLEALIAESLGPALLPRS